jgi:signal transduction histidine kinase/CheY-like chemotaxis protein/HPt (histidine-containing phosphotransfer) domain-containing protein
LRNQGGHITGKVLVGYILLVALAVCSVGYIYNIVKTIVEEDVSPDSRSREKVYLITNTLSLMYESEAMGQFIGIEQDQYYRFNRTLNRVHANMDSLRALISDSAQLLKIDTIDILLDRKRWNTRRLMEAWEELNTERLFSENIERVISIRDTIVSRPAQQVEVQKRVEVKQDTVVVPRKRRSFFRRLAEVFSPTKEDTSFVVNTTRQVLTDTVVQAYNPTDTIVSVLKSIQDSVADQRKQLMDRLLERSANLRYSNTIISREINQMLRDIEEEEMEVSLNRLYRRQELLREMSVMGAEIIGAFIFVAVIFLILIWRDVAKSKYYREQLEKAKHYAENLLRSREKLMLTISHDIRAPLSSIIGYIELLSRRHPDGRQRYYLENMKGSSDHILSLVNDLLDFQRLEAGEMEIHQVPFSVGGLFHEIYTSFKPLSDGKGLDLILNLKDERDNRLFVGDPIRIRQVVSNLLSNAIKFTREGRVVMVVAVNPVEGSTSRYELSVIVSDSGPGIPQDEQERIFGEFTRLSETENEEGFGLGLSITRKLISLMGGALSLRSEPGKGSDFQVSLPIYLSENQVVPQEEPVSAVPEPVVLDREVICLLVDDDPLQLALTEELLKQSHVRVVTCSDPYQVCSVLRDTAFDAVITDIQMPVMDGYHLLRMIRESGLPGTDRIPVIALSASIANDRSHYLEAGFTGFLNKPFTATQLISLLNELLSLRLEVNTELTFNSLTAFAGEDKEASDSILRTFVDETGKSIHLLEEALPRRDRAEVARVSHKMIPLFSMLGANSLVQHLRLLEKNDAVLTDSGWDRLLEEVIAMARAIVEQASAHLGN